MSTISAEYEGNPPVVTLSPEEVPSRAWNEISLVLFGDSSNTTNLVRVEPQVLLRNRTRFRDVLRDYGIDFEASEGVTELLSRGNADNRSLTDALTAGPSGVALDVVGELVGGQFSLKRQLRDFQIEDLEHLSQLAHGANFSVPGAGKTTVAYVLHAIERSRGRVDKLLVVAPLSAFGAWEEDALEVLEPAPSVARMRTNAIPEADVVLVNYHRLQHALPALSAWMTRHKVHLIIDEAHRAKRGAGGEWGRSILSLGPLAARRDILTGTPAPNHPRDLVPLLDVLWPSGRASALIPRAALVQDPTRASMRALNEVIEPLYVRTTKTRLGLPPTTFEAYDVTMRPLQRQIYDALLNRYAGLMDLGRRDQAMFAQMGEVTMYLLQAASSPRLLRTSADPARAYRFPPLAIPAGSRLAQMVEEYADHEVPAKIEAACRIVAENSDAGRKTLVWSNFPDNLLDMEQQLSALQPALVYGAISSDEEAEPGVRTRERELHRFRTDDACRVLLANPAALAEGVSLHHDCHDAVYIDRTFNAGQYLQSLDRIHRLGLPPGTETKFTLLTTLGTIDERVAARVKDKTERLSQMLADEHLVQMALPDEDEMMGFLDDAGDLDSLLAHLASAQAPGDLD